MLTPSLVFAYWIRGSITRPHPRPPPTPAPARRRPSAFAGLGPRTAPSPTFALASAPSPTPAPGPAPTHVTRVLALDLTLAFQVLFGSLNLSQIQFAKLYFDVRQPELAFGVITLAAEDQRASRKSLSL